MFETSSVRTTPQRLQSSFKALPASLLVHALAVAAVVGAALENISFPEQPPHMSTSYNLTDAPTPPPPPPPPPAAAPLQQVVSTAVTKAKVEQFAPTVIPDEIVPVAPSVAIDVPVELGAPAGVAGGVEGGVAGGVVGGELTGVLGGERGGFEGGVVVPAVPAAEEGPIVVPRDAPLRMTPLSQTYPTYPEWARVRNVEDDLVVRYVIGTNGRIKEVKIVQPARKKLFDDATLNAVRHWRFRPMIRDGEAREVVHELTIYFRLDGAARSSS